MAVRSNKTFSTSVLYTLDGVQRWGQEEGRKEGGRRGGRGRRRVKKEKKKRERGYLFIFIEPLLQKCHLIVPMALSSGEYSSRTRQR